MSVRLASQQYGKSRVRVLAVRRGSDGVQAVHEVEASVILEGDFAETYLTGDNSKVVATDTMKNIIHALAQEHLGDVLEEFPLALAAHFLQRYEPISRVTLEVTSRPWDRYQIPGEKAAHPHMFTGRTMAKPFSRVTATRATAELQSGVKEVLLLKSTGSAFKGFPRCEHTTLPETEDRIMATEMKATWTFAEPKAKSAQANGRILDALLNTFATEFSPSLQNTLFLMGQAALAAAPEIVTIHLTMPNKHYLPVNLQPFGRENRQDVFLPTDEPHGQIEGLVSR